MTEIVRAKLHQFASDLAEVIAGSRVVPDKALRWTIIANPCAGGFTIRRRWKKHLDALKLTLEKARQNPQRKDVFPSQFSQSYGDKIQNTENSVKELGMFGLVPTSGPGHAAEITNAVLEEMSGGNGSFYLFITAGGDGTSLEVLQTLYQAPPALRSRCAILRLPLGTGNDGAEAWETEDALELLVRPTRIEFGRGLILSTASGKTQTTGVPFLAFNILSVGLDAFVTHMTNKMKGKLPGDSYKLWVDVAALLYDRVYKIGPMEVRGYDEKKRETADFREKLLLCAMGASGHRSYGSHNMILPDDRNVCAVKQMPLFRKIQLKKLFKTGEHINKKEAVLFNANRIEISGLYPILAQMDGETVRLEPGDFPLTIALTDPVIPVLKIKP